MVISSRHTLQSLNDYTMNIHIDGVKTNQKKIQSRSLGLTINENLSWKAHIHDIIQQVSSGIRALKWVRQFVSMHTAIKIYSDLIESHVDYFSAAWDVAKSQQVSLIKGAQECWLCPSFLTKTHYTASHESRFSISLNASTRFAFMQRRREVLRKSNQTNKQEKRKQTKGKTKKKQLKLRFRPKVNWLPSAWEANVITTILRKPLLTNSLLFIYLIWFESM